MRTAELLDQIDSIMAGSEQRFDALAKKAGLDPRYDFAGMDLRAANFAGSNLRDFDFVLCDLRGTNIVEAKSPPHNLEFAITDKTAKLLNGTRLGKIKRLFDQTMNARTSTKRLVAFMEFLSLNRDMRLLELATQSLLQATQTRLEARILEHALKLIRRGQKFVPTTPDKPELASTEQDQILQLLSKSMVSGGYPYRRAEVALELSSLLPLSNGVAVYLAGLADRSMSSSPAMEELRNRLTRHYQK